MSEESIFVIGQNYGKTKLYTRSGMKVLHVCPNRGGGAVINYKRPRLNLCVMLPENGKPLTDWVRADRLLTEERFKAMKAAA